MNGQILRHAFAVMLVAVSLAACTTMMQSAATKDFFVVFFVSGTAELSPEALEIVKQVAANAKAIPATKIDIAVPAETRGGTALIEGRFTAIQNILSASGVDQKLFGRSQLSAASAEIPGAAAADRAEIRLLK